MNNTRKVLILSATIAIFGTSCTNGDTTQATEDVRPPLSSPSGEHVGAPPTAQKNSDEGRKPGGPTERSILPGEDATVRTFDPPLTLAAPEGRNAMPLRVREARDLVDIRVGPQTVTFLNPADVYSIEDDRARPIPAPDDLVTWLRSHPSLTVRDQGEVTVGGFSGAQLKVRVRGSIRKDPPVCYTRCMPVAPTADPNRPYVWFEDQTLRVIIVDVRGTLVLIGIQSPAITSTPARSKGPDRDARESQQERQDGAPSDDRRMRELLNQIEKILDSVRFH